MEEYLSSSSYQNLPAKPGVYFFVGKNAEVLYVGKAKDLKKRVSSYFIHKSILGEKTKQLLSQIIRIRYLLVESELESLLLEANLIKRYSPKYNIRLTDGKAYQLIRITIQDQIPAVLLSRRLDDKNSLYFGPFPSSRTLKIVLKTIRRIFPYQSVANHSRKTCLYYHLNLCPCVTAFDTLENRKAYKKTIRHIVQFLQGKKLQVLKELEKERDSYANQEEFEQAQKIQTTVDAINYVTSPIHSPFEYEINPNLRSDLRSKELNELRNILAQHEINTEFLERIECYDISNIAGTNAVGSIIVFTNGEKDSSWYRRFKIKTVKSINDFAMIREVLTRRLKHDEWPTPNLIVVDGGKGQISSALKALQKYNLSIPLVGLAKREETIITSDFKEIKLPKSSEALHLIQRIRDEAHRFAITYHRKLRSKFTFTH